MRFSSRRSKMSMLLSLIALTAMVGAFFATGATRGTSARAANAAASYKGQLTTAHRVGAVSTASLVKSNAATGKHLVMPYRPHPASNSKARVSSVARPSVSSSKIAAGTLKTGFQGVSAVDNSNATGGYDLEPPDEGLAASNGYAVNLVNLTGAIYTANGTRVVGPFPLATVGGGGFFNEDLTNIVSDPRAYYDSSSHLWIALIWVTLADGSASHVDISINAGNPATTAWTEYRFDVTDASAAGCPCLPDFTILGTDQYNIYFVPNEFQLFGPGFNGSVIYAVAKSSLIGGVATPNVAKFSNLSVGGTLAYHLQPAASYGSAKAEYFANSIDPNNVYGNSLGVWALTNRDKIASGVLPTLSSTVVNTETFINSTTAQTPVGFNSSSNAATSGLIQTDGDALQNLQYIGGHLYTTLTTAVNVPGDTSIRAGIAWFDITPKLSGNAISASTSVADQGYIAKQGLELLYPQIEHATSGTTAIAFSFTGPQTYPSSGYIVRSKSAKNFGDINVAAAGAAPDNGFTAVGGPGRWGDYSAGQLDASGKAIWFATQYIAGNGDQAANWSNYIFAITA